MYLIKVLLILADFVACSFSLYPVQNIDSEMQGRIDNFIENVYLPSTGVSGLGLAIVRNDKELVYTTGYGLADHEKGIRNGNQTEFLLGSVTKSFTALVVVAALHEKYPELGESVLDTPIRQLLSHNDFSLIDRFRSMHTTFRDLLSHKMCIQRDDFQLMTEPFDTTAEILYRQNFAKESCGFRTKFLYNNHMVLLASELTGQILNETFENYANNLLKKIGMTGSHFINNDDDFSRTSLRAKPYYIMNNERHLINSKLIKRLVNVRAIGGLFVTPNDMARFLRFQLNLGEIDGQQIVPEEVMRWLIEPSNLFPKFKFKTESDNIFESPLAYGLGVVIGSYDGWQKISHNGYFTPYRSEISWYPDLKIGIFTSTHEAPSHVKQQVLHAFIFETLMGVENANERALKMLAEQKMKVDIEKTGKKKVLENFLGQSKNEMSSESNITDWNDVIGKYGNQVSGEVSIFGKYNRKHGQPELYLSYGKWAKGWVMNIGGDAYKIIWDADFIQDYYAGEDMDGLGFVIIKNGSLHFVRPTSHGMITYAVFEKGVTLDEFPTVQLNFNS